MITIRIMLRWRCKIKKVANNAMKIVNYNRVGNQTALCTMHYAYDLLKKLRDMQSFSIIFAYANVIWLKSMRITSKRIEK